MRAITDIGLNDLRIFFSQRGNWISLIVLPLAFTAFLGWAMGRDLGTTQVRLDVANLDGGAAAASLIERLAASSNVIILCPQENNQENNADNACRLDEGETAFTVEQGIDRVERGRSVALLAIPAGYDEAVQTGAPAQLDYYSLEDPTQPSPLLQTVNAVLQEVNSAVVAQRVGMAMLEALVGTDAGSPLADEQARAAMATSLQADAQQLLDSQPALVVFKSTEPVETDSLGQGFGQAIPGMGALFVMFTVLGGMVTLLRERRQWTLQRLAVAPLRRSQILGGKVLAYFTLGMIQFLILFGGGALIGVNLGQAPLALLAVMAAFVLCITALTFALAPRMKSEAQAAGMSRLLSLTLAPLGGAWWPLSITPPFMQTIGHLSPVAWAMDGFQTLIYNGGGLPDVLTEVGVLLAAAAVLFAIGAATFRVAE